MVIRGRVENGVVVLAEAHALPEGADVSVSYPAEPAGHNGASVECKRRVVLPLVSSKQPGTRMLTSIRIAEFMEEDDLSS